MSIPWDRIRREKDFKFLYTANIHVNCMISSRKIIDNAYQYLNDCNFDPVTFFIGTYAQKIVLVTVKGLWIKILT